MEIIVCNTMNNYLADINLLSVSQHDFTFHCVISLLLSQYNYVNYIEGKEDIDMLFSLIFVKRLMP